MAPVGDIKLEDDAQRIILGGPIMDRLWEIRRLADEIAPEKFDEKIISFLSNPAKQMTLAKLILLDGTPADPPIEQVANRAILDYGKIELERLASQASVQTQGLQIPAVEPRHPSPPARPHNGRTDDRVKTETEDKTAAEVQFFTRLNCLTHKKFAAGSWTKLLIPAQVCSRSGIILTEAFRARLFPGDEMSQILQGHKPDEGAFVLFGVNVAGELDDDYILKNTEKANVVRPHVKTSRYELLTTVLGLQTGDLRLLFAVDRPEQETPKGRMYICRNGVIHVVEITYAPGTDMVGMGRVHLDAFPLSERPVSKGVRFLGIRRNAV